MCIAILNDSLVRISIKFRPLVPNSVSVEVNGLADGDDIRTALNEDHENGDLDVSSGSSVEKRRTLTVLASMSSARCGLGVAVLSGQLVAVGKLSQSVNFH